MEVFQKLIENVGETWVSLLSFAVVWLMLSFVEVSKIKIYPWTWLRKTLGDFFGREHVERIGELEKKIEKLTAMLESHVEDSDRRDAERGRRRILGFEREIQFDVRHSKEEFEDALETVRQYETYCKEHPEYKNHVAEESICHIQEVYRECLRKHDFLQQGGQAP